MDTIKSQTLLIISAATSIGSEPVNLHGLEPCLDTHETTNSLTLGYHQTSLDTRLVPMCDVLLQTVLDDEKYGFIHAASGGRDATDNGSSLGDCTRGAALGHGRLWHLCQHEHHWSVTSPLHRTHPHNTPTKPQIWGPSRSPSRRAAGVKQGHSCLDGACHTFASPTSSYQTVQVHMSRHITNAQRSAGHPQRLTAHRPIIHCSDVT